MDTPLRTTLPKYIHPMAVDRIIDWLSPHPVSIRITRKRNTKMGDYRAPIKDQHHRISVNGDLYTDAFLVTMVHEIAHLITWEKYRRKVKPHGMEWKEQFRQMLMELSGQNVFHPEILPIILEFASGRISYRMFNLKLEKKVHELDPEKVELLLGDIPVKSIFSIHNGRTFIKEDKLRTRYRCRDIKNGRYYLISPLAKVQLG